MIDLLKFGNDHLLVIDLMYMSFFFHGNQALLSNLDAKGLPEIKRKSRFCHTILTYFDITWKRIILCVRNQLP